MISPPDKSTAPGTQADAPQSPAAPGTPAATGTPADAALRSPSAAPGTQADAPQSPAAAPGTPAAAPGTSAAAPGTSADAPGTPAAPGTPTATGTSADAALRSPSAATGTPAASFPEVVLVDTGRSNAASLMAALGRAGAPTRLTTDPADVRRAHYAVLPGVGAFGPVAEHLRALGLDTALRERVQNGRPTLGACLGMQLFFESSEESPGVRGIAAIPGAITAYPETVRSPQFGWNRVSLAATAGEGSPDTAAFLPASGLAAAVAGSGSPAVPDAIAAGSGCAAASGLTSAVAGSGSPAGPDEVTAGDTSSGSGSPGILASSSEQTGEHAYFANSFRLAEPPAGWHSAMADYGGPFVAAIERGPVLLCQFHPELSGAWGQNLLLRWLQAGVRAGTGDNPPAAPNPRVPPVPQAPAREITIVPDVRAATPTVRVTAPAEPATRQLPRSGQAPWDGQPARGGLSADVGTVLPRIIPCLDVAGGRVVKGVRFMELRDSGDPAELAFRYQQMGADELVVLDITAGVDGRNTAVETVRSVRARLGLPLCVGGGVRTFADAGRILQAGADKVSLNSMAYRNPGLLTEIAHEFGRQCCVVAIDAARRLGPAGTAYVVLDAGRTETDTPVLDWIRRAVDAGAGEVLLTSRDRDGTRSGYDLELLSAAAAAVPGIPVIASGGAATPAQILDGLRAGASAALLAGALHDGSLTIGDIKSYVRRCGVEVR